MGQESLNIAPWAGHQFYCIETVWIPKQIRAGWLDSAALNTAAQLLEVLASRVNHDNLLFYWWEPFQFSLSDNLHLCSKYIK